MLEKKVKMQESGNSGFFTGKSSFCFKNCCKKLSHNWRIYSQTYISVI